MKAYKIKIELVDSQPLIWRRVSMPAGATFHRLHIIIQDTMGFNGEFSFENKIYEFNLEEDKLRVTNDDDAYNIHKFYQRDSTYNDIKEKDNVLKELTEISIRKPKSLKIDKYIEKYRMLRYIYDFKSYWQHRIVLEETIQDYEYKYPVLIEGEEDGPIEDIGGLAEYYGFKEILNNHSHPRHDEAKKLAEEKNYCKYDFNMINEALKLSSYGK